MTRGKDVEDLSILQMALIGYEIERQKVEDKIRDLQLQLKGKRTTPLSGNGAVAKPVKRMLSTAARNRIAAAQRKRWAEHRRRKAQEAKA
jgi:hypothetical protein